MTQNQRLFGTIRVLWLLKLQVMVTRNQERERKLDWKEIHGKREMRTDADTRGVREAMTAGNARIAYTQIIRDTESALLWSARRLCSGRFGEDAAQDLVQDALIQGYEAYADGRFASGSNAKAWLLRILMNRFINTYKRDKRWNAGVDVDTLSADGFAVPDVLRVGADDQPDAALLSKTLDEPLERALAALSEEMRICVILVDIQDNDYAQTAEILGVPIGTVRSRLSRARAALHTMLFDYAQQRRRV